MARPKIRLRTVDIVVGVAALQLLVVLESGALAASVIDESAMRVVSFVQLLASWVVIGVVAVSGFRLGVSVASHVATVAVISSVIGWAVVAGAVSIVPVTLVAPISITVAVALVLSVVLVALVR